MSIIICPAESADSEAIARIYNHYIRETVVTFEEQEVTPAIMESRMQETIGASLPWLVAQLRTQVVGFAYAGKWKVRAAYRFAVETTIYIDHQNTGQGIGLKLYQELLAVLRSSSVHAVIGGVALPNTASVALHERLGFRKVAQFNEVGFKLGRWVDVAYWQMLLSFDERPTQSSHARRPGDAKARKR
jgi:phosphinothricin acetyltransferase